MHRFRLSSPRDAGSALIEAVVIGSVVFVIVVSAVSAAIQIGVTGTEANEAARAAAVHAARHDDVAAAEAMARSLFPTHRVTATRRGDSIEVEAVASFSAAHPDGGTLLSVRATASMPVAPFRSDRG